MLVDDLPNEWKMEDGYRIQDQRSEWIPGGSGVTAKGGLGTVITHLTDENTGRAKSLCALLPWLDRVLGRMPSVQLFLPD